jgi:hypothetical protein
MTVVLVGAELEENLGLRFLGCTTLLVVATTAHLLLAGVMLGISH